jgi:hypothetical protein
MANELLKTMVRMEGRCCTHAFLLCYGIDGRENLSLDQAGKIALRLGLSFYTVYRYNKLIREGYYTPCDNCKII